MMKKYFIVLPFLTVLILSGCISHKVEDPKIRISKEVVLYSQEIHISPILRKRTESGIPEIFKRLFARDVMLKVDMTYKSAIYCKDITDFKVDEQVRTVEFTLPQPKTEIQNTHINWDDTETMVGIFRQNFSIDELAVLSEEAKKTAHEYIKENEDTYMAGAYQNAVMQLTQIINDLGYKPIININASRNGKQFENTSEDVYKEESE